MGNFSVGFILTYEIKTIERFTETKSFSKKLFCGVAYT